MRHLLIASLASLLPAMLLGGVTDAPTAEIRCGDTEPEFRGTQFLAFTNLNSFRQQTNTPGETVWTSPIIQPGIRWDELILSWNIDATEEHALTFEARAERDGRFTRFYTLGRWSASGATHPRESVAGQRDERGSVETDTLKLEDTASSLQLRVRANAGFDACRLKLLGISVKNTAGNFPGLPPKREAWGKCLDVPEISQMAYPNGGVLCSPATVSMLLGFWAAQRTNSGWKHDVSEIASGVYDSTWKGTGNWSFNMAFAGSLPGLRAYVTRLTDLSELEQFIAAGIPVGLSVCYNRLRGKPPEPSGHLVVCVGFTPDGEVIINDPGTSKGVRKVFPRKNVTEAWAHSGNTVYLVYPADASLPKDRFNHWRP